MSEAEDNEEDNVCGLFCFKPNWLQKLKTPGFSLLAISAGAFLQGAIVNGILHLVIPTIERRFNLRSVKSGLVSGGYDIASLICLIPVTYFGGRPNASKPRWIGAGMIVMGIGALIFALPHFLSKASYIDSNKDSGKTVCHGNALGIQNCSTENETKLSTFMWVLLIGNLLHGAGASPLFTLGITFIDESVVKGKSGLYMGLYYSAATIGVASGFILGGSFLQLNEDFMTIKVHTGNLSPNSQTWIGAWWLGFLILGVLSILVAIPILSIPARLPDWKTAQRSRLSESLGGSGRSEAFSRLKELPAAMMELLRNTSLVLLCFAGCCEGIVISGSGSFIPKIIQSQFSLSDRTTSLAMGVIVVPSAILGTLVGGGILRKFDLLFVGIVKLCICTTSLSMICASCFFITCSDVGIVGLNTPYFLDRKPIKLEDPCNRKCGCSPREFIPVCGVNNATYYSPCYAGCHYAHSSNVPGVTNMFCNITSLGPLTIDTRRLSIQCYIFDPTFNHLGQPKVNLYSGCTCINESLDDGIQASSQSCKISCPFLPIFLLMMYLSLFFTFVAAMPALTATLRCVKADQRSLALGMQWMLVRLLGMIPGPMLFGFILDGTCIQWKSGSCNDDEGSCILYNQYKISWAMVLLAYGWKSLEVVLFLSSIYFYKRGRANLSPPTTRNINLPNVHVETQPNLT